MRPSRAPAKLPIFRSGEQSRLLQRLYLWPAKRWSFQELAAGGPSPATVDRELGVLAGAGMIAVERVGRTRLFSAEVNSPLYKPLQQLLERTLGAEVLLRRALEATKGVEAAAIFGSWASGTVRVDSDLDLLVLGKVDHNELLEAVQPVGRAIGRELNVISYTREELAAKVAAGDAFVRAVLERPLVDVVGGLKDVIGATSR